VKDGAAAIRTLGSSIDTTTKALNPSTTLGDIEYRSATANTNTRLGIGTAGQVLTVASGVPSWATSSSGGMTLLSTTSLTGTSVTVSSIPSGYQDLRIVISGVTNDTNNATLQMQFNGQTGSVYSVGTSSGTQINVSTTQLRTGGKNTSAITVFDYTSLLPKAIMYTSATRNGADTQVVANGSIQSAFETTVAVTSLTLFCNSSENITAGTIKIYGVK
jgi:hypothetical protein